MKWFLILIIGLITSLQVFARSEANEVHLSFQERVLTAYALKAYKATPTEQAQIYARAYKYIETLASTPGTTVAVSNFNEFLKKFRGEWPSSGDLDIDLQRIESEPFKPVVLYKSASPRVQRQIDQYLNAHLKFFKQLSSSNLQSLEGLPFDRIKQTLEEHAEKQLAEFDSIGTKIANTSFDAIPDPQDRVRLRILFDQYYALQPLSTKKYIISEMLGRKMNLSENEKFEVMVQNSGPQFQKLLQVIIRQNGIPEKLKANFKALEDSAKAVPWWQVEKLLQNEKDNFKFTYFERKPIGVGTMAQVHRAKMTINGHRQDVVVRFLKPNIEHRVNEDHTILTKVAAQVDNDPEYRRLNGPMMSPLMDDISKTVREELDMKATMDRQIQAKTTYDKMVLLKTPNFKSDVQFYVPKIFGAEKKSQLMIQELVIGRSLDKEARFYSEIAPDLKKAVIEEVAKLWINEVIFGSGFYHSDLHQGNFLVQVTEPKVQVTLLDFGMGGTIDKKAQQQLLLLGVALQVQKADLITDVYWNLSDQANNQLSRKEFTAKVEQRLKGLHQKKQTENMFEWTGWASNQGLRLPYDFINMNRGLLIIMKSLEDAGSNLNFESIAKSLALKNPSKVLAALNSNAYVKWADLVKLGWSAGQTKSEEKTGIKPLPVLRCERAFAL